MFFIRWISHWPLGLLHAVGAVLGWIVWAASPTYRRRLRANARLAGVSARDQRRAIAEAGRMVAETPWLWLQADQERLMGLVQWRGVEPLDRAIAERRPLVILTPHMGAFEVAARAYVTRYGARQPLTVLYRPARQAALRTFQEAARQQPMMATAPASLAGVRQMLRALKRHETVGLLPDQVPPEGQGVWAPFFRLPAYTMTLAVRLVQQTHANCFVLRCERLPRGSGYRVHVTEFDQPLPAGTDLDAQTAAATRMNEMMEHIILQDPGQYMWGYHRYKQPRRVGAAETPTPAATAADTPEGNE